MNRDNTKNKKQDTKSTAKHNISNLHNWSLYDTDLVIPLKSQDELDNSNLFMECHFLINTFELNVSKPPFKWWWQKRGWH